MPGPQQRPLLTFDVFDTVVTRALGEPRSVGYVLAEHLRRAGTVDVVPEVFVEAHQRAEHLAYLRFGERRGTAQACTQLAELLGLDPGLGPVLEQAELDVELALTRPVPGQLAAVRAARASGAQVGFLSDTPLSRDAVEALLRRAGAMQDGDLLWVSNGLGAEKGTGRAYAAVARELGRPPVGWRHRGDNHRSDVTMARWSGVKAEWAPAASLQRYEALLEAGSPGTAGLSSLLAGAARGARLALSAEPAEPADDLLPSVVGVVGPVLAALALSAVRAAVAAGCDVLVVAGRGAADLLPVATALVGALQPELAVVDEAADRPPGRWAVVSTDVLDGGAPAGACVHLALGTGPSAPAGARGWAFDDGAGTGVTGEAALAVRGLAAMLPCGHPGLRRFADELAAVVGLLPGGADLRAAVQAPLDALWGSPSEAESRAWCEAAPALSECWPQARRQAEPALLRAAGRVQQRGTPLLRKLQRARLLVDARRQVTRG